MLNGSDEMYGIHTMYTKNKIKIKKLGKVVDQVVGQTHTHTHTSYQFTVNRKKIETTTKWHILVKLICTPLKHILKKEKMCIYKMKKIF